MAENAIPHFHNDLGVPAVKVGVSCRPATANGTSCASAPPAT